MEYGTNAEFLRQRSHLCAIIVRKRAAAVAAGAAARRTVAAVISAMKFRGHFGIYFRFPKRIAGATKPATAVTAGATKPAITAVADAIRPATLADAIRTTTVTTRTTRVSTGTAVAKGTSAAGNAAYFKAHPLRG